MRRHAISPPAFIGAVTIILAFAVFGAVAPGLAEQSVKTIHSKVLSRFGTLMLGPDDSEPDFPYLTRMAMLFTAGMGIELMYFAIGEPMMHFGAPPGAGPRTIGTHREAW